MMMMIMLMSENEIITSVTCEMYTSAVDATSHCELAGLSQSRTPLLTVSQQQQQHLCFSCTTKLSVAFATRMSVCLLVTLMSYAYTVHNIAICFALYHHRTISLVP